MAAAVLGLTATINLISFLAYGIDKKKARKGTWRIPERVLLGLAACGGAAGAYAGMHVFHHKTLNATFRTFVPVCLALQIIVLILLIL